MNLTKEQLKTMLENLKDDVVEWAHDNDKFTPKVEDLMDELYYHLFGEEPE